MVCLNTQRVLCWTGWTINSARILRRWSNGTGFITGRALRQRTKTWSNNKESTGFFNSQMAHYRLLKFINNSLKETKKITQNQSPDGLKITCYLPPLIIREYQTTESFHSISRLFSKSQSTKKKWLHLPSFGYSWMKYSFPHTWRII